METPIEAELNLLSVIGYSGQVVDGLILHPDNETLIFPIGSQIVVRNVLSRQDHFLKGHNNDVSVLCLSPSGKYLATGQKTFLGFKADVIIWDLETYSLIHRFSIHKYLIQSLSFSFNEKYLVSLGGADDNYLIIWDIATGKALCGNTAGTDYVYQVKFYNQSDNMLVTCQNYGIRIWTVDYQLKTMTPIDVNFGNLKRQIQCMFIDPLDKFGYFGTKSGDILEIELKTAIYRRMGPLKRLFSQGVSCIKMLPNSDLLVGTAEGTIAKISYSNFKVKNETKLLGGITSISFTADFSFFFCGTDQSNIYWVESSTLKAEIRNTCHNQRINDIQFPYGYSGVFGTCSKSDIRIWNTETRQEHLRIHVPNLECFCFGFMRNGKMIYSGWHDGKIRAFLPQSGKLLFCISEAHRNGVTAITSTSDNYRLVSGGMGGEIRIWRITPQSQTMEASLKEHRGRVWSIVINSLNDRAITASADGSCIIWDIKAKVRLCCMFETTMFKQLVYHPDESQILTIGSDKKITYWEAIDGLQIRMVDGSIDGEINTIAMCNSGEYFATAGEDREIKLWDYETAQPLWRGIGNSGIINKIVISPNQQFIISASEDGSIFIFETPEQIRVPKADAN
ncbi:MAG: WD40 repeat domain-containing protein, partial [archaeon]|nr:WD40 repeat domain-containing protein [archaeon]